MHMVICPCFQTAELTPCCDTGRNQEVHLDAEKASSARTESILQHHFLQVCCRIKTEKRSEMFELIRSSKPALRQKLKPMQPIYFVRQKLGMAADGRGTTPTAHCCLEGQPGCLLSPLGATSTPRIHYGEKILGIRQVLILSVQREYKSVSAKGNFRRQ